ncbi:hypothetical protein HJG54_08050 [Leptolyngbya sp. NK1-12]|uniref:Uncharacterized protein n=1 Tax=Leptolyngbya sp. NK1-12 TaxID=2547451 RepID=A0AA96WK37_9CYAN|nr:hypothetical protein [Leptolyngbya sp. NK1-12]WNZ22811.1 hypothetical protein HJG54_08050 [Leptolyngbya sp. NK1-12]
MNQAALLQTNGAAAHSPQAWLKQTVQQFFGSINWEDQPPEIQHLRLVNAQTDPQPLSLFLTVDQFFSAFNWAGDGTRPTPQPLIEPMPNSESNGFTLEDFSDLF